MFRRENYAHDFANSKQSQGERVMGVVVIGAMLLYLLFTMPGHMARVPNAGG